jgi:iron complex outermembrane receptor protein
MGRAFQGGVIAFGLVASGSAAFAATPTPVDTGASTIQEVVVTAQKREERLQDVPINVTVVGNAQLTRQNVTDTTSLTEAVPSLTLAGGTLGGLEIRGIGTQTFARSAEPSVSIVADGVVLDRNRSSELFDVDNVEVLNGPQGMLFGRNSSAGVVSIVTNAPRLNETSLSVHADLGEHDDQSDRIIVNAPLGADAALRVSGHYDAFGHTVYDALLGKWDYNADAGVRARLLWEPTSNVTVNLIADYDRASFNGVNDSVGAFRAILPATGNPGGNPANLTGAALASYNATVAQLQSACGIVASPSNNRTCVQGINGNTGGVFYPSEFHLFSAQVDWRLGGYTLTSISAERRSSYGDSSLAPGTPGNDAGSVPVDWLNSNLSNGWAETISQELRIASPASDRLSYVAGVYISSTAQQAAISQTGMVSPLLAPLGCAKAPFCSNADNISINQQDYAVFGQATLKVTDHFNLIAGARETDDYLHDVTHPFTPAGFTAEPATLKFLALDIKDTRTNFSWRLGGQYVISHDLMVYVTAAQGYKGALVNDQLAANGVGQPLVLPEIPMDYEVGIKSTWFDQRLGVDLALFHDHVKNFQTTVFIPSTPAGFATGNVPFVTSQGVDLSFFGKPLPNLTLNGGVLYDDAQYSPGYTVACSPLLVPGQGGCFTADGKNEMNSVRNLIFAPNWKVVFSVEYDHPVASGLTGYVQSDVVYTSRFNYSATPDPNLVAPEFTRLGARVGIRTDSGRWGVAVFARNLLDQRIPTYVGGDPLSSSNGLAGRSYVQGLNLDSYRVVGVSLDGHF